MRILKWAGSGFVAADVSKRQKYRNGLVLFMEKEYVKGMFVFDAAAQYLMLRVVEPRPLPSSTSIHWRGDK